MEKRPKMIIISNQLHHHIEKKNSHVSMTSEYEWNKSVKCLSMINNFIKSTIIHSNDKLKTNATNVLHRTADTCVWYVYVMRRYDMREREWSSNIKKCNESHAQQMIFIRSKNCEKRRKKKRFFFLFCRTTKSARSVTV